MGVNPWLQIKRFIILTSKFSHKKKKIIFSLFGLEGDESCASVSCRGAHPRNVTKQLLSAPPAHRGAAPLCVCVRVMSGWWTVSRRIRGILESGGPR